MRGKTPRMSAPTSQAASDIFRSRSIRSPIMAAGADWNPDKLTLLVHRSLCAGLNPQQIISKSQAETNVVKEMICELRAVKPMREPRRELQTRGQIEILPVD